jgi:LysR family transcriptional regulator, hypochlorite-specific transcription factor HypT
MELNWLDDCLALAETLNFSRAAAARHVTQPAFSRRILALEEWVGTPLFARSRQGVQLTPAGEAFRRRAGAVLASLHAARNEALEVAGLRRAPLVFLATHVLSFTFFPALMRRSDQASALGAFQLVSDTMRACEKLMLQGAAQFLLCHHHPRMRLALDPARFQRVVVGTDVLQPFTAPLALGMQAPWTLHGHGEVPLLAYSEDSGLGRIVAGDAGYQALRPRLRSSFTSDLAATLAAMCRAGNGVAWLPRTLVEDDLAQGRLLELAAATDALRIPVDICLLRPRERLAAEAEQVWERLAAQGVVAD